MLQMKQDADDFVRTREQTTQPSVKIHQHLEIEQFDVHNVTLGPGPVSDLSAVDGNDCHQWTWRSPLVRPEVRRRLVLCHDVQFLQWYAVVSA